MHNGACLKTALALKAWPRQGVAPLKLIGVDLGFNFKDLGLLEKPVEYAYYDPHHSPPPVYICIHIYINVYLCMYVCMYICMYVLSVYMYVFICIYVCVCVCVYMYVFICIYVCVCVCTHTHTHTHRVDKTGMTAGLIYSIRMICCIHMHLRFLLSNTPGNINFEKVDKAGHKHARNSEITQVSEGAAFMLALSPVFS
jgi:hypothetical protein